jgi:mannosyltransferase OCH1-like enzyme
LLSTIVVATKTTPSLSPTPHPTPTPPTHTGSTNYSMDGTERSSARARPKTPPGLWAFFVLLILVGYQTLEVGQLPSFDLMGASTAASSLLSSASSSSSSSDTLMMPIDLMNLTIPTHIRRITQQQQQLQQHKQQRDHEQQSTLRKFPKNLTTARRGMPLSELTASPDESCRKPMRWMTNKELLAKETLGTIPPQRIPRIIHQTSKSRCIHREVARETYHWRDLSTYRYYFHDDAAIWRLIDQAWPEFPSLHAALQCVTSMTAVTDVWRLLVLWEYGGIYTDLDATPHPHSNTSWTPAHIHPDDDAYFVVEFYDALSQYWMALSPRHPLMFYTIHAALARIMTMRNVLKMDASLTTGPFALLDGFALFTLDTGPLITKPVYAGVYVGTNNRTVRVDGYSRGLADMIIKREALNRPRKLELYKSMNMTHFLQDMKAGRQSPLLGRSCLAVQYDLHLGPPEWFVPPEANTTTTS